jgi:hypothetical protein
MGELFTPSHLILLPVLLLAYFLPTFIAGMRSAEHYGWIAVLNLLVGGTGIGWIILLLWACYDPKRSTALASSPA